MEEEERDCDWREWSRGEGFKRLPISGEHLLYDLVSELVVKSFAPQTKTGKILKRDEKLGSLTFKS